MLARALEKRGRLTWLMALGAFALLNSTLYSCLLPLWEGFDEPFHYAYVERLATHGDIPLAGRTPLSAEIWESLHLAPGSPAVTRNLPFVTAFSDYFALTPAERSARRRALYALNTGLRWSDAAGTSNYEAQQPPLAYLLLAAPDSGGASLSLPARVLMLRLICGAAGGLLTAGLTIWLAAQLGLSPPGQYAAAFIVLCSQMFYACVARVANDWLAIPLVVLMLIGLIRFRRQPRRANAALLGAAIAAGLMAKAYVLSWALFTIGATLWTGWHSKDARRSGWLVLGIVAVAAGPWHVRNVLLYGNVSGVLLAGELGWRDALHALPSLSWPKVLIASAHGAIWTGNNSLIPFSARTVDMALALMLAAAVLWLLTVRESVHGADEWLMAAACCSYIPALVYYCGMLSAFARSPGVAVAPWYLQVLSPPLACLLILGCARAVRFGRWTATALLGLSAYVLCATYLIKLIPLYSGYPAPQVHIAELWGWYLHTTQRHELLATTAMASPAVIWTLAGAVVVMCVALCLLLQKAVFDTAFSGGRPRGSLTTTSKRPPGADG